MATDTETDTETDNPPAGTSNVDKLAAIAPNIGNYSDRTLLGGIGVSARISLFVFVGIVALTVGAFGLFLADKELTISHERLGAAHDLHQLAGKVENDIWKFRTEGAGLALADLRRQASKRNDQENIAAAATLRAYGAEHTRHAAGIVENLDRLYRRADTEAIREHITTLSEALAQYSDSFGKETEKKATPPDMTGLELELREAARTLEKLLNDLNMLGLNGTMKSIRAAEMAFIEDGRPDTLVSMGHLARDFSRLLESVPLADNDKKAMGVLMNAYQTKLAAYAKARLVVSIGERDRLAEIISYMSPSLDGIVVHARRNLTETIIAAEQRRRTLKALQGSGALGLILLLVLTGSVLLRSIAAPVSAAAEVGRHLAAGKTDIVVGGLGNEDETGDIMRAFSALKKELGEVNKLREGMKKAKAEAERGRAATAEADWLRRDLESIKPDLDKGRDALEEVQLLRKVIEATKQDITLKQEFRDAAPAGLPEEAAEQHGEEHAAPIDTISIISQQVAASSQTVTEAAEEAERTGTLIRNLTDAADKIESVAALITSIARQADMLVVDMPADNGKGVPGFVVIPGEDSNLDGHEKISGVSKRFDIIRADASQATWAVRDIAGIVRAARESALDIARTTSADALEVTTDLLQQSENLRGMLDQLVHKMQDQLETGGIADSGESGKT